MSNVLLVITIELEFPFGDREDPGVSQFFYLSLERASVHAEIVGKRRS